MMTYASPVFAGPEMFAAVPAKHWSYDAVAQLAKAGIIDGYEDGYNGRSKITRYDNGDHGCQRHNQLPESY